MEFDSTFWVAISFVIFFGVLIYFKIPRKINEALDTKISEIKNELDEIQNLDVENRELILKKETLEKEKKEISKSKDKSLFEKSKEISSEIDEITKKQKLVGGDPWAQIK